MTLVVFYDGFFFLNRVLVLVNSPSFLFLLLVMRNSIDVECICIQFASFPPDMTVVVVVKLDSVYIAEISASNLARVFTTCETNSKRNERNEFDYGRAKLSLCEMKSHFQCSNDILFSMGLTLNKRTDKPNIVDHAI